LRSWSTKRTRPTRRRAASGTATTGQGAATSKNDERELRKLRREEARALQLLEETEEERNERLTRESARSNPSCSNVVVKKLPFDPANLTGAGNELADATNPEGVAKAGPYHAGGSDLLGQPASVNSAYAAVKAVRAITRVNPSFRGGGGVP
jgi:hypothetical protein